MDEGKLKLKNEMSEESDSNVDNEADEIDTETQNTIPLPRHRRSYVWKHFAPVPGHQKVYRCKVCDETFGAKTANLGRHLQMVHSIHNARQSRGDAVKKGRPNRSFVWNFCTKLDEKRALCHLCKKVLYFGGGNTSNITKHLRRMHAGKVEEAEKFMSSGASRAESFQQKGRKSTSYVWNYCEKLSENTVLCKLCNRRMRFHGTANVISHLQRRHDVMDETSIVKMESSDNVQEAATSSTQENPEKPARHYSISGSLVWKYITRLSEDTVRCRVCLKNLSYQGTSNLQRHLHRMHNIIWTGNDPNVSYKPETDPPSEKSFFDFCETTSDPLVIRCQMCGGHFEHNDTVEDTISRHMIRTHGAASRGDSSDEFFEAEEDELSALYTEVVAEDPNATAAESVGDAVADEVATPEADDALYNAIIEVEGDLNDIEEVGEQLIENTSCENSLSAQSGGNVYSDYSNESNDDQLVTTTIQADDTPVVRELKEDLLRQQALYFNEKAGFYRMQKFLVAQQVRKERLEIEKLKAGRDIEY